MLEANEDTSYVVASTLDLTGDLGPGGSADAAAVDLLGEEAGKMIMPHAQGGPGVDEVRRKLAYVLLEYFGDAVDGNLKLEENEVNSIKILTTCMC